MKLSSIDLNAHGYTVYDCEGKRIPDVFSYNTETQEVCMYIDIGHANANSKNFIMGHHRYIMEPRNSEHEGRKRVTFVLDGSYVKDKDGNRI